MGLEVLLGAASAHGYDRVDSDCGDGGVVCESKATGLDPSLSPLDSLLLYSTLTVCIAFGFLALPVFICIPFCSISFRFHLYHSSHSFLSISFVYFHLFPFRLNLLPFKIARNKILTHPLCYLNIGLSY